MNGGVDYIATAKRDYEGELTHLKVHLLQNEEALAPEARAKDDVVSDILVNGKTVYTATPEGEEFILGKQIRVVQDGGEYYLRTDEKTVREDALEELPKF